MTRIAAQLIFSVAVVSCHVLIAMPAGFAQDRGATKPAQNPSVPPGAKLPTAGLPQQIAAADITGCGCPLLATLAKNGEAVPGSVAHALNEDTLEALMSNRNAFFGGWPAGLNALRTILEKKPLPKPIYTDIPLREGFLSDELINDGRRTLPPAHGDAAHAQEIAANKALLMNALVATIARANKYGEPEFLLRSNSMLVTQFITSDLIAAGKDHVSVRSFVRANRQQLFAHIANAGINAAGIEKARAAHPVQKAGLSLDLYDMANASLDVLTGNDKHESSAPRRLATMVDDNATLARELLLAVQTKREFGGEAIPNSPQDIIACRAFAALVQLASPPDGDPDLRRVIFNAAFGDLRPPPNQSAVLAAYSRAAIHVAHAIGFGDAQEAANIAKGMFEIVMNDYGLSINHRDSAWRERYARTASHGMSMLKWFEQPNPKVALDMSSVVAQRDRDFVHALRLRLKNGSGGPDEKLMADAYDAAVVTEHPGSGPVNMAACTNGMCNKHLLEEKPAVQGPFDKRPFIVVRPTSWAIDSEGVEDLHREEQFSVSVMLPPGTGAGKTIAVVLKDEHTGASTSMTLYQGQVVNLPKAYSAPYKTLKEIGLATNPGDYITVSYGVTTVGFHAYDTPLQESAARSHRSLGEMANAYQVLLESGGEHAPPEMRYSRRELEMKLHAIDNARRILRYQPRSGDKLTFTDLTRARVGVAYIRFLQTDPGTWDQSPGTCGGDQNTPRGFRGADPRFRNVVYETCEESMTVNLAIRAAEDEISRIVYRGLVDLTVEGYKTTISAMCVPEDPTGLLCLDTFWIAITGTDVTGKTVSRKAELLKGIRSAIGPAALGLLTARLKQEALNTIFPEFNEGAINPRTESDRVAQVRRSQGIKGGTVGAAVAPYNIGSDVNRLSLEIPAVVPGSRRARNAPKGYGGSPRKDLREGSPGRFLFQVSDDTCLMMAVESARRDFGLTPRTEAMNIALSAERAKILKGKIYSRGTGTNVVGMAFSAQLDGLETKIPDKVSLADISAQLKLGNAVVAEVNVAKSGKPQYHAVRVLNVADVSGTKVVTYGDSWNGEIWEVDGCGFENRMRRDEALFLHRG